MSSCNLFPESAFVTCQKISVCRKSLSGIKSDRCHHLLRLCLHLKEKSWIINTERKVFWRKRNGSIKLNRRQQVLQFLSRPSRSRFQHKINPVHCIIFLPDINWCIFWFWRSPQDETEEAKNMKMINVV